MKKTRGLKKSFALLLVAVLTTATGFTSLAAEDRTKITSIRLKISSGITVGTSYEDIDITTTSSHFSIGEIEILNDYAEWEAGDVPRAKVYLYADSGYYFSSTSSSVFTLNGDKAAYVSAKTEDSKSTMVLTFKLEALEGDLEVEDVEWDDDESGIGYWSEAEGASYYQVRLYRSSSTVTSILTSNECTFDFSSYITKTGSYSFRVRASGSGSSKGEWVESGSWYIDSDTLTQISSSSSVSSSGRVGSNNSSGGSWHQDGIGWWFRNTDGTWPVSSWKYINNRWYYFGGNGYMATGWVNWNNAWYYCDVTTGAMLANTKTPDGFTVGSTGAWLGY